MRAEIDKNMERLEALKGKEKTLPPGDIAARVRKRIDDINTLMIKADAMSARGRNPSFVLDRIENLMDEKDETEI